MKKLLPILMLVLIIPQVAFAAWWNPFSWRKQPDIDTEKAELLRRLNELEQKVSYQEISSSTDSKVSSSEIKEKIVTKTITVDNPELQKKINDLIAENVSLQVKVNSQSSLVQQLNSCKADLTETRAQLGQVSNNTGIRKNGSYAIKTKSTTIGVFGNTQERFLRN